MIETQESYIVQKTTEEGQWEDYYSENSFEAAILKRDHWIEFYKAFRSGYKFRIIKRIIQEEVIE